MKFKAIPRQLLRHFWQRSLKSNFGQYSLVEPGAVSPQVLVPDSIPKPSYHATGEPTELADRPEVKSSQQVVRMRAACKLAANILQKAGKQLQVGQTTNDLDVYIHEEIVRSGAYPSPLNYRRFPKSVCTSVNNVACHGIPDDRPLEDGDIINVDITVFHGGCHGDCSRTFLVGAVDERGRALVRATETCLLEAVALCRPRRAFSELGAFIQRRARQLGFAVVPAFIGHGIGSYFHGPPDIYHIKNDYPGEMEAGMTFTIEPVLTQGRPEIVILEDDWTAVTLDTARTAQFEHTVLITDSGVEILTKPD